MDANLKRAAVFFVGNKLMLDEGIGPAAYEEFCKQFIIPENVEVFDVGCMSLDMLKYVDECDFILSVDALDNTGKEAGSVFRFSPSDMARTQTARASLHDMKLADLFDSAALLGYEAHGVCVGMQVENMSPERCIIGLTPKVYDALPLLVETVAAELSRAGFPVARKS